MMKVNTVMLVHNRKRLTVQALDTLFRNTPNELFNLTVVDDASDWPVHELCGSTNSVCLRINRSKNITGMARNLGVYWAEKYWGRGEWLCLLDNDLYFTPYWLERLAQCGQYLESYVENRIVIGGWNHPFLQPHQDEFTADNRPGIRTHDAVTGACQLMRWETWDKYGPLDAHAVGVGQSEDWKFCQDVIKDGGVCGSVYPRVVLNCGVTNSFGQPSPGADLMIAELREAQRQYGDLIWE